MARDRDNGHITRVIESGDSRFDSPTSRFYCPADEKQWLSERDALRYNEHPYQLTAEVPRDEWRKALRRIERVVEGWTARQTPEQRVWASRRKPPYLGTLEAARLIARHLEQ